MIISVFVSSLCCRRRSFSLPRSADLVRARSLTRRAGWLTGCWASSGEGVVVWLWDEVRGHGPEGLRQKPDHSRGLIMKPCCWSPAGTPARAEHSGPPVSETWWNAREWTLFTTWVIGELYPSVWRNWLFVKGYRWFFLYELYLRCKLYKYAVSLQIAK